jgi:hypothetical protein
VVGDLTLSGKLFRAAAQAIAACKRKNLADRHLERLENEPSWIPLLEEVADVAMVYGVTGKEFAAMNKRTGGRVGVGE